MIRRQPAKKKARSILSGRYANHNLTLTLSVTETGNNLRVPAEDAPAIAADIPQLYSSKGACAGFGEGELFCKGLFYLDREIFQDSRFHLHFSVHYITVHNYSILRFLKISGATTKNEKRKHRCEKFNRPCVRTGIQPVKLESIST